MPKLACGAPIRRPGSTGQPGLSGCLASFPDLPNKLFLLAAGHSLIGRDAAQFDPVEAAGAPGEPLGVLFNWTGLDGPTTTDVALVQVDPSLVLAEIVPLGAPKGANLDVVVGDKLTISVAGQTRTGAITQIPCDRAVRVATPDGDQDISFLGQILCEGLDAAGCDGAIALDKDGRAAGMVVAGGADFALITPIDAVTSTIDWGDGPPLQIVSSIPPVASPPPKPVPHPAQPVPLPGAPSSGASSAGSTPQHALALFLKQGWSRAQAIGLIANIQAESGFKLLQPGDGGQALGLCQWHGDRQQNFQDRFHHPMRQSSFEEQIAFINFELRQGTEREAGRQLQLETTPEGAARVVSRSYERPRDRVGAQATRARFATEFSRSLP